MMDFIYLYIKSTDFIQCKKIKRTVQHESNTAKDYMSLNRTSPKGHLRELDEKMTADEKLLRM